jgi:molybdopterin-guanine dinucleotide biosynthesis protein A
VPGTAAARPRIAIFGLILAGGEGRRLGGRDKALVGMAGRTLAEHAIARLAPQVGRLALSVHGESREHARFGIEVLPDPGGERVGPLAGLAAGLAWLETEGGTHLATVPVDLPFLPADLVARLLDGGAGGAAVAVSGGRMHPTCGLWPVGLRGRLAAALAAGERRLGRWADLAGAARVEFPPADPDPFFNVNTPGDLAEAGRRLEDGV